MKHLTEGPPTEWLSKAPAAPTPKIRPSCCAAARRGPGGARRERWREKVACGSRQAGCVRRGRRRWRTAQRSTHRRQKPQPRPRCRQRQRAPAASEAGTAHVSDMASTAAARRRTVQRARRRGNAAPAETARHGRRSPARRAAHTLAAVGTHMARSAMARATGLEAASGSDSYDRTRRRVRTGRARRWERQRVNHAQPLSLRPDASRASARSARHRWRVCAPTRALGVC